MNFSWIDNAPLCSYYGHIYTEAALIFAFYNRSVITQYF